MWGSCPPPSVSIGAEAELVKHGSCKAEIVGSRPTSTFYQKNSRRPYGRMAKAADCNPANVSSILTTGFYGAGYGYQRILARFASPVRLWVAPLWNTSVKDNTRACEALTPSSILGCSIVLTPKLNWMSSGLRNRRIWVRIPSGLLKTQETSWLCSEI